MGRELQTTCCNGYSWLQTYCCVAACHTFENAISKKSITINHHRAPLFITINHPYSLPITINVLGRRIFARLTLVPSGSPRWTCRLRIISSKPQLCRWSSFWVCNQQKSYRQWINISSISFNISIYLDKFDHDLSLFSVHGILVGRGIDVIICPDIIWNYYELLDLGWYGSSEYSSLIQDFKS